MKKLISFSMVAVVIFISVFSLQAKPAMAYIKLESQIVSLETPRSGASLLIGYQHEIFFVFDNQSNFGTYFKAEKCAVDGGCEGAVVEIYRIPDGKTANEVLPTFSNGGAELLRTFPEDGYDLLEKGQYIIKIIGPKSMTRINLTWNPRRVP